MNPRITASREDGRQKLTNSPTSNPSGFGVFGLCPELSRAVNKLGWDVPSPVQQEAIPPAMEGHDIVALAQTGTGKTGAFLLPILEAIRTLPPARPHRPYCVILAPTRELVKQIETQVIELSRGLKVRSMTVYGGVADLQQKSQLRAGVELVAATPGRLLDLIGQGVVHFEQVTHCVLDEADRMFDMGFINDMRRILSLMPSRRQTLLFSATMPPEINRLAQAFLFKPREIRLSASLPPPELRHEVWELIPSQKDPALASLLREDYDSVLVFTRTKHRANSLARRLDSHGESVAVLHGNRSQNQRDQAMARFRSGEARVLVATDVASRGLDITGIGLVVNYDTPRDPGDYVHRVGRTARAKRQGYAVSFMVEDEAAFIKKIEQLLKQRIARREQYAPGGDNLPAVKRPSGNKQQPEPRKPRKPADGSWRKHDADSRRMPADRTWDKPAADTRRKPADDSKRKPASDSKRKRNARPASSSDSQKPGGRRNARTGGTTSSSGSRPARPKTRPGSNPASRGSSRRSR